MSERNFNDPTTPILYGYTLDGEYVEALHSIGAGKHRRDWNIVDEEYLEWLNGPDDSCEEPEVEDGEDIPFWDEDETE